MFDTINIFFRKITIFIFKETKSIHKPIGLYIPQLMAMITWTKKKFKQIYQYRTKGTYCGYMGDHKEIKKQHSFRRQQLPCSAQSAQMAGYFSLSTTGPSKGVLFFNFFMVSHVATICTFGPILVDLLELFFGPSDHCHELCML